MIKDLVSSIIPKYSKQVTSVIKLRTKAPKPKPLPVTIGLPEKIPIYKSFFHVVFPKNFDRTIALKRELLLKSKEAPLPSITISAQKKALILNSSASDLIKLLNDDTVTSQELVYTFMERCQQIGIDANYVADLNIEEAFEEAKRCDQIRSATPRNQRHKLGLLFGVPVSIKENIPQKGFDSTCGLAAHCFAPSHKDSLALELLRKEGAIPFVRSTVPQLLSVIENVSNIWQRANNPWNDNRSCGGSSGGEGGLIATRCSPLGVGTDGMGSLRLPATWCGIYSFKPTSGRLSWKLSNQYLNYLSESRWNVLHPCIGPMGRSVDDLVLVTKCLTSKENRDRDPHFPYVPWNQQELDVKKKLKIGYVVSEDLFGAHKAARRAVLEAIEVLRSQGHEVEEVRIPGFSDAVRMGLAFMTSDGTSKANLLNLNGEKLVPELRSRLVFSLFPRWIRRMTAPLLQLVGEERAAFLSTWTAGLCGYQWLWILHEKDMVERKLFDFWREKELDAIITPGAGVPALKHGTSGELSLACCYLWIANMFNLPAGIVPVTRIQKGEDHYGEDDTIFKDYIYPQAVENMKESEGLPVGVQVLTLPYEDEKCLGIMKQLEGKFPAMLKL